MSNIILPGNSDGSLFVPKEQPAKELIIPGAGKPTVFISRGSMTHEFIIGGQKVTLSQPHDATDMDFTLSGVAPEHLTFIEDRLKDEPGIKYRNDNGVLEARAEHGNEAPMEGVRKRLSMLASVYPAKRDLDGVIASNARAAPKRKGTLSDAERAALLEKYGAGNVRSAGPIGSILDAMRNGLPEGVEDPKWTRSRGTQSGGGNSGPGGGCPG